MKAAFLVISATICADGAFADTPKERAHDDRRGHVRGCPLDLECRDDADLLKEFEFEAFAPSEGPWVVAKKPKHTAPKAKKAIELRPDLPWLKQIKNMPDLPVRWNHRLIRYLEFYKNDPRGRRIIAGWLRKQGRYKRFLESQLVGAGLPRDLVYVSMIESSYSPHTKSYAGAVGLWQLMRHGGKYYGLRMNRWVDERRDPVRSTEAALMYWKDLHDRFGNWELALAAYNAGYGAVLRAIAKYNTNDYWQLCEYENSLPWGAQLYVAKTLAVAIVGHNREVFGFTDLQPDAPITWDVVTIKRQASLSRIANAAGTTTAKIKELNPHLARGKTPPVSGQYRVYIPRGMREQFAKRFPQNAPAAPTGVYVVKHGERFEDIATTHGVSRYKLKRLNGVRHEAQVRAGEKLVVPKVSKEEKMANAQKADDHLYQAGVPRGSPLIVAVPDRQFYVDGSRRVFYRVISGDSLYRIARVLGVDPGALATWNGLKKDARLHPRMVLQAFVNPRLNLAQANVKLLNPSRILVVESGSEEHLALTEERIGRRRRIVKVKRPMTFKQLGARYGLTARDMARINRMPPSSKIEAGQPVVVYEVFDRKKSKRAARQHKRKRRNNRRKK